MNTAPFESERFLRDCGATGPLELSVEGPAGPVRHVFRQPFVVIGRSPHADLGAGVPGLHARHAYLQLIGGRLLCVDLSGRNRSSDSVHMTWARDKKMLHVRLPGQAELRQAGEPRFGWLVRGQTLRVGPLRIRRVGAATGHALDLEEPESPFYEQSQLPVAELEVLRGKGPATWRMQRPLALLGRSPHCKIHLCADGVSRFHCALVGTPQGHWAVDLLGRGGTRVNATAVRAAPLSQGDELRIGSFLMRLHQDERPPADELVLEPISTTEQGWDFPPRAILSEPALTGRGAVRKVPSLAVQLLQFQQQMFEQFQEVMTLTVQSLSSLQRDNLRQIQGELDRARQLTRELIALQTELVKVPRGAVVTAAPTGAARPGVAGVALPPPLVPRKPEDTSDRAALPNSPRNEAVRPQPTPELHDWLRRRIDEVRQERKTSWQAIRRFLGGQSAPAKGPPA